ncbi:hypothetical protein C8J56DRAFT_929336 [Mycena floridula]|nr:hypothetical protein C8J56DRAFT_929336 [Mycena floridula]
MGRPRKYTTEEERREANSASKRTIITSQHQYYLFPQLTNYFWSRNRCQIQKRRKIHRLSHADAEHIIEEPTLEERQQQEQIAQQKKLQMDRFWLEQRFTKVTGNLGRGMLPMLVQLALGKSYVQELRQQVGDLECQMDKAFAGGLDAQACSKLFDRLSGLAEDLENAKNYCSQGLEKLHTGGFQRIIEWRDYQVN